MLLNVVIFMWYGAVCPWQSFVANDVVPIHRLIPLGVLILLLRRPPFILGLHKKIPQLEGVRQATFMGFFGPIGCSAVFYLYITVDFVRSLNPQGGDAPRDDVEHLEEAVRVIVWFMVIASVVVHGLSIPLGKLGFRLPRTISRTISTPRSTERSSFQTNNGTNDVRLPGSQSDNCTSRNTLGPPTAHVGRPFRIGGSLIAPRDLAEASQLPLSKDDLRVGDRLGTAPPSTSTQCRPTAQSSTHPSRTIRFPDEEAASSSRQQLDV
ncbi:putative sodium hydrogen exchanger family protein [Rosellinia necatrix]|uniref:Putative sodium hydrogen exchanger family protein n=1 Tax=Rosellinia necatrix TaxID=77044 RepID=A0A1S8A5B4_ROSNE|nr:putative sodium hydrogen exchanger family protein [Rosellinia necatrix]